MFDSVGRNEQRQAKRQAGAFLLSLALNGSFLGALVWAGSKVVEEVIEDEIIEVAVDLAAPPPPPPPPPPAGGSKKPKTEKKKVEEEIKPKEETPVEVVPLEVEPEEAPVVESEDEGVEGGVVGGVVGGVLGGQLGGTGVKVVHWSEAEVKVRAQVRESDYPQAAIALRLPDERCIVRINIDEKGVPYEVVPKTCAEIFRGAARDVAMRYRFYPVKDGGKAVKAGFDLTINFKAP